MNAFRAAVESGDPDRMAAELARDVVFHSPVAHTPYHGRDTVGLILRCVFGVFEDFRYVEEVGGPDDDGHVLVFRARVGERDVQGIDLLRLDDAGLVAELTVMVRPLSGTQELAVRMKAALQEAAADR